MSERLQMFLSLPASVYCLVKGEFSTNDKGLLLTSNGTTDNAGVFPGELFLPWGCGTLGKKAGYKHTFMIVTTVMEACTSQCDPCLSP